ncbi:DegT/DnrJ/EryC1/StrS family aminotransferase [Lentisphaerota bacterium ZTH]|nr:DegT/DnrJ/EryC1/StrS family aminotransferase [Lentisphaerota bacterium]WET05738.1 DegT/DnrJ/EryC1/StrS family aminotransferase [Lentisphaerota bacterium ZTH]
MSKLALLGGSKAVTSEIGDMFHWPIANQEMEKGIVDVLREGSMSGSDITKKFEREFADWHGVEYGLACSSGTASLHCAMFGAGIGVGDEIIAPSITYWATCTQALSLGASVVFADILPDTLCIDPADIERKITERTKAVMVVHYMAMPAEMDEIMRIARKHNIKVIEDVSHAHGALYKGQMVGTFGDAAGFSLMSGKSFAIGEGGILLTNNREIYERAILFGQYARHGDLKIEELQQNSGLPWGGYKYRMHQMSSAVGVAQMKKYPAEIAEIDKAMNYFWDLLEDTPGIQPHRPSRDSGSTMGGWYAAHGLYKSEELGGLSLKRFTDAVTAEGYSCTPGCNLPLHTHPLFSTVDVYGHGKPTQSAFMPEGIDNRQAESDLPVASVINDKTYSVPWFKHFRKDIIEQHADAFKKVAANYQDLLPGDTDKDTGGSWGLTARKG